MVRRRGERAVTIALWAVAVGVAAVLTVSRYRSAVGSADATDITTFLHAGAELRGGHDVYDDPDYTYSPLLAWLLAALPASTLTARLWTLVSLAAGWGAVAAVTATLWRRLRPWQRPVLAGVAAGTLLWSYPTDNELALGQVDLLTLLLTSLTVMVAGLGWAASSGALVALAGLLKTWPGGFALWFLRRGAAQRGRQILGAVATVAVFCAVMLVVSGPADFGRWVQRTVSLTDQARLVYSVWGAGRFLFTANPVMPPLVDSPPLAAVVSLTLAAIVVALLVIALRRPGTDSLAMWHVVGAVVMLLPVSHIFYRILMFPLLWVWVAEVLRRPTRHAVGVLAALAAFWVVTSRLPVLQSEATHGDAQYIAIMTLSIVALAASVVVTARMAASGEFEAPPRSAPLAAGSPTA